MCRASSSEWLALRPPPATIASRLPTSSSPPTRQPPPQQKSVSRAAQSIPPFPSCRNEVISVNALFLPSECSTVLAGNASPALPQHRAPWRPSRHSQSCNGANHGVKKRTLRGRWAILSQPLLQILTRQALEAVMSCFRPASGLAPAVADRIPKRPDQRRAYSNQALEQRFATLPY